MEGKSDEEQEEEEEREVVVVVRGKHSLEDKGTVILSLLSLSLSLSLSHFTAERNSEFSFLSFGIITQKKKKFFFLPFFLIPFPEKKKKRRRESTHTQNTQGERESEEQRNKDVFLLEQMD